MYKSYNAHQKVFVSRQFCEDVKGDSRQGEDRSISDFLLAAHGVRAKSPTMYCGRCSRAFRAVLKRQEVKGRVEFAVCSPCTLEDPAKMTSEKVDVIYPSPKKTKFEQLRADHELFLQAFESRFVVFGRPKYTVFRFIQFSQSALDL